MSNYKTVHFKVLPDNCSAEDLLDDKTHQRIADKLYEIISANPKDGLTIGLEGEWGSGKSTVVKLLQEKLKEHNSNKTFVFYIDAWEHEGDHLRRVFLETLIEKIKRWEEWSCEVVKRLNDISDRVTSKRVSKKIEHTSQITGFGKWVAFAALFVPFGAALLATFAERVTFEWTGHICWEFWVSLVFSLAPVWVYCVQYIRNWCNKNKPGYALFETEANVDTIYETSQEEERSSVEFERYFGEILQIVSMEMGSMIMVIDNLDRVNSEDALRIWSTLQAFVQNKNPTVTEGKQLCKWIIVPYAQESLSKIWEEGDCAQQNGGEAANRPLSFMNKSFQLRLHVPKMVISGWKGFARMCIGEAAPNLEGEDVEKILNVLSWTRNNLTDAPSPRQIKIYINQVGLACSLHGSRVHLEAICFYVVKKYLNGFSDRKLESELRDKKISAESLPQYEHCYKLASEVAAILYGVEEDKAMQILLEPIITENLRNSKCDELRAMEEMHRDVFYDVLDYILKCSESNLIPKFVGSIQKAFSESNMKAYNSALNALRLNEDVVLEQTQSMVHEDAIAIIKLASTDINRNLMRRFAKAYASDLPKRFRRDGGVTPSLTQNVEYVDTPSELVKRFAEVTSAAKETIMIPYKYFKDEGVDFSKFAAEELNELARYMNDKDLADEDVAEQIQEGKPIPEWVANLFFALTSSGMTAIQKTIESISRTFAWNNGQRGNGIYGIPHWDIIVATECIDKKIRPVDEIKTLLLSGGYWHFTNFPNNQTMFLLGKYHGELTDQELTPRGFQPVRVNKYRELWNNRNYDIGIAIHRYITYSHEFDWLAAEASKPHRALVGSVVEAALDAKDQFLFDVERPFDFYASSLSLVDESHRGILTDNFTSNKERLKKLAEVDGERLVWHPKACCNFLNSIKDKNVFLALVGKIKSELVNLTQEEWSDAFNSFNGLAELVLLLVENGESLELANPYSEALKSFVSERIRSNIACDFSSAMLEQLYKVMKPALQKVFATGIGEILQEMKFEIATDSIKAFVLNVPDYEEWMKNASITVKNISAELSNVGHLETFDNLMTIMERCGDGIPNKEEIRDVIEHPVQLLVKHSDETMRAVGERAARYFDIAVVNEEVESNEADEKV